ncbi:MAG: hypothetical protein ACM3SX_15920 [Deltaproteobacteria bacterium]
MSATTSSAKPFIRLWSAPPARPQDRRPLLYSIDEALGVVFIDLLAVQDAHAVVRALQQVRLDPSFRRDLSVCVDCRCLTDAPDADDVRAIAALWPRGATSGFTGRCAIVASSAWAYVSAKAFTALAGVRGNRVQVFASCATALLWLTSGL